MQNRLSDLRTQLDVIDNELITLLADRFQVTYEIGLYKAEQHLTPRDPAREKEKLDQVAAQAVSLGLDPTFAQKIVQLVMAEVVKNHTRLREQNGHDLTKNH